MRTLDTSISLELSGLRGLHRKLKFLALVVLGIPAAAALLAFFYWQVSYPTQTLEELSVDNLIHIAVNVAANIASVVIAARMRGEFPHRVRYAIFATLLVYAAFLVFILLTRQYYSRPMLLSSFAISMALIAIALAAMEKWSPLRIGAIPTDYQPEVWSWLRSQAALIPTPHADVRNYDIVLVDWGALDPKWNEFLARASLSGCSVEHVAKFVEARSGRVSIDHFEPSHASSAAIYVTFVKRPFDMAMAAILLPLSLPVLIPAMLAIRLTMGSPVIFKQQRVGRGGVPFTLYKLRTMTVGSENKGSATSVRDARVTPLGKFLRRTRIDEIPQLYNILRGDMSLVGPRPEQPKLAHDYETSIPGFGYREMLPPGLTGWAQICAGYAATAEETRTKLTYDLYYLKHVSFLLDLWIMLQTFKAVVLGTSSR